MTIHYVCLLRSCRFHVHSLHCIYSHNNKEKHINYIYICVCVNIYIKYDYIIIYVCVYCASGARFDRFLVEFLRGVPVEILRG
jgi:hypothetical protein